MPGICGAVGQVVVNIAERATPALTALADDPRAMGYLMLSLGHAAVRVGVDVQGERSHVFQQAGRALLRGSPYAPSAHNVRIAAETYARHLRETIARQVVLAARRPSGSDGGRFGLVQAYLFRRRSHRLLGTLAHVSAQHARSRMFSGLELDEGSELRLAATRLRSIRSGWESLEIVSLLDDEDRAAAVWFQSVGAAAELDALRNASSRPGPSGIQIAG